MSTRACVVVLFGLALSACPKQDPPRAPETPSTPAPTVASSPAVEPVAYGCPSVAGPPSSCGSPPPRWLTSLLDAAHSAFDDPMCPGSAPALRAALAAPLPSTDAVKVVAQNAALRMRVACEGETRGLAQQVVERLALPAAQLQAIGARPRGVERVLGGAFEERAPVDWPLMHERDVGSTQLFRMGRFRERFALVGQLVAIDDAGRPHVTPFIDGVEMRDGAGVDAPACVARLDRAALGCGEVALRPLALGELPSADVERYGRVGDGVSCRECHPAGRAGNFEDKPSDAELEKLRLEALFDGLSARLARH